MDSVNKPHSSKDDLQDSILIFFKSNGFKIFISLLAAVLAILVVAEESQDFIGAIIIGFVIVLSVSINMYLFYQNHLAKVIAETNTALIDKAINKNFLFFGIFDEKNQLRYCPYYDFNFHSLGDVLKHFNLTYNNQKIILNSVSLKEDISIEVELVYEGILHKAKIAIKKISIDDYKLYQNNYFFLKIESLEVNRVPSIDSLPIGYFEMDELWNIQECNNFFARNLGYSKEEFLDSIPNLQQIIISSNNLDSTEEKFHNGFFSLVSKYNEQIDVLLTKRVIYDDSGKIAKIIAFMIKLPDKNLILKAKGVEEGWLDYSWQCFFAQSPYPVAIIDIGAEIKKFNNAAYKLLNIEEEHIHFLQLFHEDSAQIVKQEVQQLIADSKREVKSLNNLKLAKGGKLVDVYLGRILDLNHSLYGFMVRIADVTEQKNMEAILSHGQRMQTVGQLAGSIAHDFNNLLTAILGFCDLLILRHNDADPSFPYILQIRQSTIRASNLVNRLLAFSRKQTLQPQVVDLHEFFGDFYPIIQRLVGNNVAIKQDIPSNVWNVKVDLVQFEQVILNLVVNAHHAMNEKGVLQIKVKNLQVLEDDRYLSAYILPKGEMPAEPGEYVAIEIEDNGNGIPKEIVDSIFEPFFTTKEALSGTGLGLSTVYGIIMQSGGYLYLKTQVGFGTSFLILLPRTIEKQDDKVAALTAITSSNLSLEADKEKYHIILVEDEEAVRLFAKQAMISKGYKVIDFPSPKEAMSFIHEEQPCIDLIISDVVMPGMTGPAMINEVKRIHPDVKVIFISGFGEDAFSQEFGEDRDFNFLSKPFSLKDLVAKVNDVFSV